ncbi:MAG: DUF4291 family protein [Myxococcales bacterium]|nr:DUF4291 family protein [Myxococcales bacterium]
MTASRGTSDAERRSCLHVSLPGLLHATDWGRAPGHERILLSWVHRRGFEQLLHQAVPEEFDPTLYGQKNSWRLATRFACTLVRWTSDVDVHGKTLGHHTPAFSLRGPAMRQLQEVWVERVEDRTGWVAAHRGRPSELELPVVRPYRCLKGELPGLLCRPIEGR